LKKCNILITGITGFLGSHIAAQLVSENYFVIGLKRKDSNTWRCEDFSKSIHWVDIDENVEIEINKLQPAVFIHCAWGGAEAHLRDDESVQYENLIFLRKILSMASNSKNARFIALGSQAEYGFLNKVVD
jgi:nucleoside-diphosphate-sugar epimerase